jgi:HEAT repeat protein
MRTRRRGSDVCWIAVARLLGAIALLSTAAVAGGVVDALAQPSPKAAAARLQQALARRPKSEELLAATAPRHWPTLRRMAEAGPAERAVVRTLLHRLQAAYPARKDAQEGLEACVDVAVKHPKYAARFDASMILARRYGALAVPALVERLSSENAEVKINTHIALMNRLGTLAVMPLVAALRCPDRGVRVMVAGELGVIGDVRALPALSAVAGGDRDGSVRLGAARARDKLTARFAWAKRKTTADLYASLAEQYYEGRLTTARSERPMLWRWRGRVIAEPVSPHRYLTAMAARMAAAALRHHPGHEAAKDVQSRTRQARQVAEALLAELG